ncbi:MAG: hypothetical protein ACR2PO_13845 [Methyloligellaceae bacterium]
MAAHDAAPIACTLTGDDYACRTAWIRKLARDSLKTYVRDGLTLHLIYAGHAREKVREMMAKEQTCCAFLCFEMQDQADEVRLTIRAPEQARAVVDTLFDEFVGAAG